jgi:hypothetical protein
MSLVGHGLPCFPCGIAKKPTTPRGFKDATRDPEALRELWKRYPRDSTFPAPVPLGPRAVGWLETEIMEWQERRIAERGKRAAAPASAIK